MRVIRIYKGKPNATYSYSSTYGVYIPTAWNLEELGVLPDVVSCEVHEEKNGTYELSMTYVSVGINASLIATDCILSVYCPLRKTIGENYFRIYRVEKDLGGHILVSARQIAGDLVYFGITKHGLDDVDGIQVFSENYSTHGYEDVAFSMWLRHASNMNIYFTFNGDATIPEFAPGSGYYMDFCTGTSARAYLGGEELQGYDRTALQMFRGCAYVWDKWDISLWKNRGRDRDVQITYGTNMAEMNANDDTDGVYTYVCAFYLMTDGTTYRKYVSSLYATDYVSAFAISRIKMLDCSSEVTSKYPEGASTATITAYLNNLAEAERDRMNAAGVPVRTITVDVVEAEISDVYLCDTLQVIYKRNGIELNTRMEIVSYTWDVVMQRYTELTLGAIQMDLAKEIVRGSNRSAISGLQSDVATIEGNYTKVAGNVSTLQTEVADLTTAVNNVVTSTDGGGGGNYSKAVKFADGTMIAALYVTVSVPVGTHWGQVYYSTQINLGSWPVAFVGGAPYVVANIQNSGDCWVGNVANVSVTSAGTTYIYRPVNTASASYHLTVIGVGRWK